MIRSLGMADSTFIPTRASASQAVASTPFTEKAFSNRQASGYRPKKNEEVKNAEMEIFKAKQAEWQRKQDEYAQKKWNRNRSGSEQKDRVKLKVAREMEFKQFEAEVRKLGNSDSEGEPGSGSEQEDSVDKKFNQSKTQVYKRRTSKRSKDKIKKKLEIEKLIRLGAKPRKNENMNYKALKIKLAENADKLEAEKADIANGKVKSIAQLKELRSSLSLKQEVKKPFTKRKTERGGILKEYGKRGKVAYKKKKKHH